MRNALRKVARDGRGSMVVEFALMMPVMLLLAGSVFELGALMRTYAAVNRLAMQYALSFADCSDTSAGVCQAELNQYGAVAAIGNIAPQITAARLTLSMAQVKMSGALPTIEYSFPSSMVLSAAQTSALTAVVPSGQTGIVVTATYAYSLLLLSAVIAPIIGSNFSISYTVAQLKT